MKSIYSGFYKFTVILILLAMTSPAFAVADGRPNSTERKSLTEDQKILHVLVRIQHMPKEHFRFLTHSYL